MGDRKQEPEMNRAAWLKIKTLSFAVEHMKNELDRIYTGLTRLAESQEAGDGSGE